MMIPTLLALAVLQGPQPVDAAAAVPTLPRVLFLTHSAGFEHGVVRRTEPGQLALAERQLIAAARHQFVVDATQDCATISATNLARYDTVMRLVQAPAVTVRFAAIDSISS